jgi:hypothetical protein
MPQVGLNIKEIRVKKGRLQNSDGHCFQRKGKGKSGGARVITCVKIVGGFVYLLTTYSKSEKENISNKELHELLKGLE